MKKFCMFLILVFCCAVFSVGQNASAEEYTEIYGMTARELAEQLDIRATGYTDGVYIGSGQGRGSMIQLEVTVTGGAIAGIRVLRQAETPEIWARATAMIGRLLGLRSDAAVQRVDAVTSATYSSEGIRAAVLDALRYAQPEVDCPAAVYTDVNTDDWYHEGIDFVTEHGLMDGVGNGLFRPDKPMTRAMLVTVLWRHMGCPEADPSSFADVPQGLWYSEAVAWAAENNIVNGVDETTFRPDSSITREQTAAILYRLAKQAWIDTSARADLSEFPDADSVSGYALDAMQWCVHEGIISGADGRLLPQGSATRAQVATLLMRYFESFLIQ